MLTEEQQRLVEQYRPIPYWVVNKKIGTDSQLVRYAAKRLGSIDDLIAELQLSVIRAVVKYDPDRGATLKTWVIWCCIRKLENLADLRCKDKFRLSHTKLEYPTETNESREEIYDIPYHILDDKELKVIKERYSEDPKSHEKLGKELGVSRQYVGQIELKALGKLRRYFNRSHYGGN